MIESKQRNSTIFASLMRAVGFKVQAQRQDRRFGLLGMGGALGRGEVRHCSTWDIGNDLPTAVGSSLDSSNLQSVRSASNVDVIGRR